jgi:hypothetical protein
LKAPARGPVSAALTLLLLATAGCGARHTEQASNAPSSGNESSAKTTLVASTQTASTQAPGTEETAGGQVTASPGSKSKRAGTVHRITLSERRCIRFDPQWTSIRVGQSLTWHSDLKTPLTIYISPGIFPRDNYTIRPGQTVSTGPAQSPGRYSFWTEPCACREAPRGVLLAGPGVRVQETFYASAPGIRPGVH